MCLTLERGGSHLSCLDVRGQSLSRATDEGARKTNLRRTKHDRIKVDQCPFASRLLLENIL